MGHTYPFSRYPQDHDLSISNPNAYNFLYYTVQVIQEKENSGSCNLISLVEKMAALNILSKMVMEMSNYQMW